MMDPVYYNNMYQGTMYPVLGFLHSDTVATDRNPPCGSWEKHGCKDGSTCNFYHDPRLLMKNLCRHYFRTRVCRADCCHLHGPRITDEPGCKHRTAPWSIRNLDMVQLEMVRGCVEPPAGPRVTWLRYDRHTRTVYKPTRPFHIGMGFHGDALRTLPFNRLLSQWSETTRRNERYYEERRLAITADSDRMYEERARQQATVTTPTAPKAPPDVVLRARQAAAEQQATTGPATTDTADSGTAPIEDTSAREPDPWGEDQSQRNMEETRQRQAHQQNFTHGPQLALPAPAQVQPVPMAAQPAQRYVMNVDLPRINLQAPPPAKAQPAKAPPPRLADAPAYMGAAREQGVPVKNPPGHGPRWYEGYYILTTSITVHMDQWFERCIGHHSGSIVYQEALMALTEAFFDTVNLPAAHEHMEWLRRRRTDLQNCVTWLRTHNGGTAALQTVELRRLTQAPGLPYILDPALLVMVLQGMSTDRNLYADFPQGHALQALIQNLRPSRTPGNTLPTAEAPYKAPPGTPGAKSHKAPPPLYTETVTYQRTVYKAAPTEHHGEHGGEWAKAPPTEHNGEWV